MDTGHAAPQDAGVTQTGAEADHGFSVSGGIAMDVDDGVQRDKHTHTEVSEDGKETRTFTTATELKHTDTGMERSEQTDITSVRMDSEPGSQSEQRTQETKSVNVAEEKTEDGSRKITMERQTMVVTKKHTTTSSEMADEIFSALEKKDVAEAQAAAPMEGVEEEMVKPEAAGQQQMGISFGGGGISLGGFSANVSGGGLSGGLGQGGLFGNAEAPSFSASGPEANVSGDASGAGGVSGGVSGGMDVSGQVPEGGISGGISGGGISGGGISGGWSAPEVSGGISGGISGPEISGELPSGTISGPGVSGGVSSDVQMPGGGISGGLSGPGVSGGFSGPSGMDISGPQISGDMPGVDVSGPSLSGDISGPHVSGGLPSGSVSGPQISGGVSGPGISGGLPSGTVSGPGISGGLSGPGISGDLPSGGVSGGVSMGGDISGQLPSARVSGPGVSGSVSGGVPSGDMGGQAKMDVQAPTIQVEGGAGAAGDVEVGTPKAKFSLFGKKGGKDKSLERKPKKSKTHPEAKLDYDTGVIVAENLDINLPEGKFDSLKRKGHHHTVSPREVVLEDKVVITEKQERGVVEMPEEFLEGDGQIYVRSASPFRGKSPFKGSPFAGKKKVKAGVDVEGEGKGDITLRPPSLNLEVKTPEKKEKHKSHLGIFAKGEVDPGELELDSPDLKHGASMDFDDPEVGMQLQGGTELEKPEVDIEGPQVAQHEGDLEGGHFSFGGGFKMPDISVKGPVFVPPKITFPSGSAEAEGDIDVKTGKPKVSVKQSVKGDDGDRHSKSGSLGRKFKMPGFNIKGPKFGWKGKGDADVDTSGPDADIHGKTKIKLEGPDIDVKKPRIEGGAGMDVDVSGPDAGGKVALDQELEVKEPKGKGGFHIKGPKFNMPSIHFGGKGGGKSPDVSMEGGGGIERDVHVQGPDVDMDVSGPDADISGGGKVSVDEELQVKGPKAKGGFNIKGPKFNMPSISMGGKSKGPDVDASLDVKGPGVDVQGPDVDIHGKGDIDVQGPEGDIDIKGPEGDIDAGGKGGFHIKGPKFNLPSIHFGGKGGGDVDVKGPDADIDVKGPKVGVDEELEVKEPKGKGGFHIKGPKFNMPSIKFGGKGGGKSPDVSMEGGGSIGGDVDVRGPDANIDVSGPDVDISGGGKVSVDEELEIKGPKGKGGFNIKGPKFDMPSIKFGGKGKGDIDSQGGGSIGGDVDIHGPGVDVSGPDADISGGGKVSVDEELEIKGPKGKGGFNIKGPKFDMPSIKFGGKGKGDVDSQGGGSIGGDVDIHGPGVDISGPDADISGGGKVSVDEELEIKGPKGKGGFNIKGPKFDMPSIKFGGKGKGDVDSQGGGSIGGDVDIHGPSVDVSGPDADISGGGKVSVDEELEVKGPKGKGGFHIKGPKFDMPSIKFGGKGKGDVDSQGGGSIGGDVDIHGPDVDGRGGIDMDVSGPDVDIGGGGKVSVDEELEVKGPKGKGGFHIKGPKFDMPSIKFGGKGKGDVDSQGGGSIGGDVDIHGPNVDVSGPDVDISGGGKVSVDEELEIKGPKGKGGFNIKGPKFDMPSIKFGGKGKGDVDSQGGGSIGGDVDIHGPSVDVSGPDADISGGGKVSVDEELQVKGPKGKGGFNIKGPKFNMPSIKFGGKGKGDVDSQGGGSIGGDVDIHGPGVDVSGPDMDISGGGKVSVDEELEVKGPKGKGGFNIKGPKFNMPSIKFGGKGKGDVDSQGGGSIGGDVNIRGPDVDGRGGVDMDVSGPDVDIGGGGKVSVDEELEIKGPKGKGGFNIKGPKFDMPSIKFGGKGKGDVDSQGGGSIGGDVDIHGPDVDGRGGVDMDVSGPDVDIGGGGKVSVDEELEIKGPKGKGGFHIKGPKFDMPSIKFGGKGKGDVDSQGGGSIGGDVDIHGPSVDVSGPDADISGGGKVSVDEELEIKGPKGKGGFNIKGPKFDMPSIKFGGKGKGDVDSQGGGSIGGDVDIHGPGVDISGPDTDISGGGKVSVDEELEIKGPKGKGGFHIKGPKFDMPSIKFGGKGKGDVDSQGGGSIGGDVDIHGPGVDVSGPDADISGGGKVSVDEELEIKGPKGKGGFHIKGPKFDMPSIKFGGKGKGDVDSQGGGSIGGDVDIRGPSVDVSGPDADISGGGSVSVDEELKVKGPKGKGGFNIKGPKFNMPSIKFGGKGKGDVDSQGGGSIGGDVDIHGPGVDISGPDADISGGGKVSVDEELEVKGPKGKGGFNIKGPKFNMPSIKFGGKGKGDVDSQGGGSIGGDVDIRGPDVDGRGGVDMDVSGPDVDIGGGGKVSVDEELEIKGPKGKGGFNIKGPKFDMPSIKFGGKGKGDVDSQGGGSIGGDVDIRGPDIDGRGGVDMDVSGPDVDIGGGGKVSVDEELEIKGPKGKGGFHIKGPKFDMPSIKFGGKGKGDVDSQGGGSIGGDVDIHGPSVDISGPDADISGGGKVSVDEELEIKGPKGKGGFNIKGPKFDMPSIKFGGKGKGDVDSQGGGSIGGDVDIHGPSVDVSGPDADISGGGKVSVDEELEIKGPKGKGGFNIKGPKFDMPSIKFGGKGKGDVDSQGGGSIGGDVDIHGPSVDVSGPDADISGGGKVSVDEELEIKGPKGKGGFHIKGPKFDMPSIKFGGKGKGDVDVEGGGSIGGDVDVRGPDMDVDGHGGIDIRGPGVDMDVSGPDVNIGGGGKVSVDEELEVKEPKGKGGFHIKGPKFNMPSIQFGGKGPDVDVEGGGHIGGDIDVKGPDVDIRGPSGEIEGPDVDIGGKGKIDIEGPDASLDIKGPKVDIKGKKHKRGISPFRFGGKQDERYVGATIEVREPQGGVDVDLDSDAGSKKGSLGRKFKFGGFKFGGKADADHPSAKIDVDIPGGQVKVTDPDKDSDAGSKKGTLGRKFKFGGLFKGGGDVDVKGPDIHGPDADISGGGKVSVDEELEVKGPKGKGGFNIKGPKFDMPSIKFGGKGKGPDVDLDAGGHVGGDVDIRGPKVDIDVKGPDADIRGPDISGGGDIDIHGPEGGIKGPDVDIEGGVDMDVDGPDIDGKGKGFHIKGPKFKLPSIGFGGKGGADVDVEGPDIDGKGGVDIKGPSADLDISGPDGKVSVDEELEIKEPKGKGGFHIKGPKFNMPSIHFGGKGPDVDVEGGGGISGDVDIQGPDVDGRGGIDVKGPDVDMDVSGPDISGGGQVSVDEELEIKGPKGKGGFNIKGPKFNMPSIKFGGKGKGDIDMEGGGSIDGDVDIRGPDVHGPDVDVDIKGPRADIDVSGPDVDVSGGGGVSVDEELQVKGPKGKGGFNIKGPKFNMPSIKFGGKGKGDADVEGGGSIGGDVDIHGPGVDVSGPDADISGGGKVSVDEELEVKGPKGKGGFHIKGPKFDMPSIKFGGKGKGPDVDVEGGGSIGGDVDVKGPKVDIDVSGPDADIRGPDISGGGDVDIHGPDVDIDGKKPKKGFHFKGPKFNLPSFGFGGKGGGKSPDIRVKGGGKIDADVDAPDVDINGGADIDVRGPEGDLDIGGGKQGEVVVGGSVEVREGQDSPRGGFNIKGPKFNMPSIKFGGKGKGDVDVEGGGSIGGDVDVHGPGVDISGPDADISGGGKVSVDEELEIKGPKGKGGFNIKGPKFDMPSIKFGGKGKGDVDVEGGGSIGGDVDIHGPGVDVSGPDADISGGGKVSVDEELEVKGPKGKGGFHIKGPKFDMPSIKFGGKGKGDLDVDAGGGIGGDVDVQGPDVDIRGPKVDIDVSGPDADIRGPDISGGGDINIQGPEGDIRGPEVDIHGGAGVDIDGPDVDGKKKGFHFKGPKFNMPSFGFGGKGGADVDVEGPDVHGPDVDVGGKGGVDINVAGPDADISGGGKVSVDEELEVKGPKGKGGFEIKGPKFTMPSISFGGKGKGDADIHGPDVDVKGPKVDVDVSGPDADVRGPSGDVDIDVGGKGKVDIEGPSGGIDIKGPKVDIKGKKKRGKSPFRFGGGAKVHGQGEKVIGDTDEVTEGYAGGGGDIDIKFPKIDTGGKKGGSLGRKFKFGGFKIGGKHDPDRHSADIEIKGPKGEFDIKGPKGDIDIQGPKGDIDIKGPKGGIDISGPGAKGPDVDVELALRGPSGDMDVKGPSGDIDIKGPSGDFDIKGPSGDIDIRGPKGDIDIRGPSGDIDIKGPSGDIDVRGPEGKVDIDSPDISIGGKGGKKHKFKMPSIGLKGSGKGGVTVEEMDELRIGPGDKDSDAGSKKGTLGRKFKFGGFKFGGKGDIDVKGPEGDIRGPDVDIKGPSGDIDIKGPSGDFDIKGPSGGIDIKGPSGDFDIKGPSGDIDIKGPSGDIDIKGPGGFDIKGPSGDFDLRGPSGGIDIKGPSGDVDIEGPSGDIDLRGPSGDIDIKGPSGGIDIKGPSVDVDGPQGDVDAGGKFGIKLPKFHMKQHPKDVTVEEMDELRIQGGGDIDVKGPEGDVDIGGTPKGKKFKIKMPHIGFGGGGKGDVDLDAGGKGKFDVDVPSGGVDVRGPEVDLSGGADIRGPQVDISGGVQGPDVDGSGQIVMPSGDIDLRGPQVKGDIPGVDVTLSGPGVKGPEVDVEGPDVDGKGSLKLKGPKIKMPGFSFGGKGKQPEFVTGENQKFAEDQKLKGDLDVSGPDVHVEGGMDPGQVKLQGPDIDVKGGAGIDVSGPDAHLSAKDKRNTPGKRLMALFQPGKDRDSGADFNVDVKHKKRRSRSRSSSCSSSSSEASGKKKSGTLSFQKKFHLPHFKVKGDKKDKDKNRHSLNVSAGGSSKGSLERGTPSPSKSRKKFFTFGGFGKKSPRADVSIEGKAEKYPDDKEEFIPMEVDSHDSIQLPGLDVHGSLDATQAQDLPGAPGSESPKAGGRLDTQGQQSIQLPAFELPSFSVSGGFSGGVDLSGDVITKASAGEQHAAAPSSFRVEGEPLGVSTPKSHKGPGAPHIPSMADQSFETGIEAGLSTSLDSGTASDPSRHVSQFVVVAIDFGTTYSGYAFSFTHDPTSIHMMRKWEGGDPGVINQKTPTCLLLTPEGKFHSFGFTARDFYHDLDPEESREWLYFDKFKMALHYMADLNEGTTLTAINGQERPALEIFSHALHYFKEHALQQMKDQSSTNILNEDVRWVITVPAIWKAEAKQFMRRAAYDAGIASPTYPDQLLIALEPEAASIYCRKLRLYELMHDKPSELPLSPKDPEITEELQSEFVSDKINADSSIDTSCDFTIPDIYYQQPEWAARGPLATTSSLNATVVGTIIHHPGTRYIVVDCGGGTVDITVHEILNRQGNLKELYRATGGPYGSIGVDREFEALLVEIFGTDFIEAFRHKRPAGYVDLMIAFESRKRAASPYKTNPLNISLPFSFIDFYKKWKGGGSIETAIRKYGNNDVRWSTQGMMRLMPDAMKRLFEHTLGDIRQAIGDVLSNPKVTDIEFMFLVGGFAESPMLRANLEEYFGEVLRIMSPSDVGLSILKGAVHFGLDPTVVNVRRSRLTYGVGVLNRFREGMHPESKRVAKDGQEWCTDVFDMFVCTDQPVALGDTVLRSYTPAKRGQKSSIINIYSSERSDIHFITDPGVRKCGTLYLDLSALSYDAHLPKRREIQTRMIFGDTEIKVSALDVATNTCVGAGIDFLNK